MPLTRAGSRRRRVLNSEPSNDSDVERPSESGDESTSAVARYADGAVTQRQPRVTDFVPRRKRTLLMLAAIAASMIAGLIDLHDVFFTQPFRGSREAFVAFDLNRPANLVDWLASASMWLCAAACLLVFAIRRHRSDDYRGSYLSWIWVAGLFAACSVWLATPIRDAAAEAVCLLGQTTRANAEVYCVIGVLTIAVLAALRMAIEMRESRLALLCLTLAGFGWAVASGVRAGLLLPPGSDLAGIVRAVSLLGAQSTVLLGILSFARRACLEAEGKIAVATPAAEPPASEAAAEEEVADEEVATPKPKRTTAAKRTSKRTTPARSKTESQPAPKPRRPRPKRPKPKRPSLSQLRRRSPRTRSTTRARTSSPT